MEARESKDLQEVSAPVTGSCTDPYLRCALNGAAQTVLGVKGCGVLSHAPQGCEYLVNNAFAWQECDYMETLTLCTKLCEDEIVHGGEDLLRRTILEAKDLPVSALFVLSACGPEIVGDDIASVCREMQPLVRFPLIPIESAGFRGSQYDGIDIALQTILERLATREVEKIPRSVCLLAPQASANPSWMADLAWVREILFRMGVRVAAALTHRTTLAELEGVGSAEFSLVLSHDAGQKAADQLARTFGTEQLCRGSPLPIGMTNTRRWLTELGEGIGAGEAAAGMVAGGESMVMETCRRKWPIARFFHRTPAAIVADATLGIPLVRFATEDMEMTPELVALHSSSASVRDLLAGELRDLGLAAEVVYGTDVFATREAIGRVKPRLLFGSTIERHAGEGLGVAYTFEVARPMRQFRLINRPYFGYTGILNLFEIIQNEWTMRWRSKERRYQARW